MDRLRPVNSANSSVLLIGRRKEEEKYVLVMPSSRNQIPNSLAITLSIPLRHSFLTPGSRRGGTAYLSVDRVIMLVVRMTTLKISRA